MFYSCRHFILLKWKAVFTGIKFSFCPRKKSEIFCKNYKFPQQQLHKNVWSCPSGCLLTCLKWKAVCTHGWKYTHQEKLIMQIFAKREQSLLEASAVSCRPTPQTTRLGEKAKGQPIWKKPGQKPHLRPDSNIKNILDTLPKKLSFDSHIAKYYQR